jgi:putative molybdopterin biosynthesis protein
MEKTLLTLEDSAKILNVTYPRAAQLAREGIFPTIRLGRQIRVDPDQLADFLARGGRALPGGWRREPAGAVA